MSGLDELERVADAVLFEGYLLYPYRASAQKNQLRWQFGVLVPPAYATESGEPSANRTECLLEARPDAALHVRLRFLRLRSRTVYDADGRPVAGLEVDGQRVFPWDEGVPATIDAVFAVDELLAGDQSVPFSLPEDLQVEPVDSTTGPGSVHRRVWPLTGRIVLAAAELPGPYGALRLRLDVVNESDCPPGADRDAALRGSLIAAHTLLALDSGEFLSATDPPEWARAATAELTNSHTWPVLAGPPERSDLVLSSPIILPDHPELAPESPTELFDGTEIDEILSLRTLALTDEEKAEARATDPKAAALIDSVDQMPPEVWERLHGAIRSMGPAAAAGQVEAQPAGARHIEAPPWEQPEKPWWTPGADASVSPETDTVLVGSVPVGKGSVVLLRPRTRGDAQDQFLVGMRATVHAVLHDVDGEVHVAVSLDDDPAAELQLAHGRFRYFRPDELEPVTQ